MKIKELDILGFKSFVDRTTLTFEPGITAIVGPNGCGKSNIVDAIRWVMGEQSPRHLRGKDMEDVIFGGSEGRKPLGMAEVSMVFSNEDGNAPEEYREFNEIMVTRRLFRSGESEYLINKVPCRLKDITELFMGTGVGTRAYSIVEQGQIGLILNSKPQERRFLIEEAAGITKYKSRKKEAVAKMESTRQNLQRVNDIIGEVKRQMNSLDRQARKAEKFKAYRSEIKEIELKLFADSYIKYSESLLTEEEKLRAMEEEGISMETRARGSDSELETLKNKMMVDERVLGDLQEKFYTTTGMIQKKEDRIEHLRNRREDIEKQEKKSSEELERLRGDAERAGKETESLLEEIERNKKEQEEIESGLMERMEEYQTFKAVFEDKGRGLDSLKGEMIQIASQLAHSRNAIANLEKRLEEISKRVEKNLHESEGLAGRVAEIQVDMASLAERLGGVRGRKEELTTRRDDLIETITLSKEELKVMEKTHRDLRDELSKKASQLHSIESLQDKFEGYADGVKAIKLSENGDRYMVVSDIFETGPEFEIALEAALEGRIQQLVVRDINDGVEGIGYLKTKAAGRCGFISAGFLPHFQGLSPIASAGAVCIPLLEKVTFKAGHEEVARFLLGNTFLIDSIQDAVSLAGSADSDATFVTKGGDMLEAGGVLVGGSNEVSGHGILQRKREIKALGEEVGILRGRVQEMEEGTREAEEGLKVAESELEIVKKSLHDAELEAVHLEKDTERHSDEIKRLTQRIEVMKVEENHLMSDKVEFEQELQAESVQIKEYLSIKEGKESAILELQEGLLVHKGEMDRVNSEVTDLRIKGTSIKGRFETLNATLEKVTSRHKELIEMASMREVEIAEGSGELEELEAEIYRVKKELRTLLEDKDVMDERLAKARETWQAENDKLKTIETGRQRVMRELDALRKEVNSVELVVSKLRIEMSSIAARVSEGFNTIVEEAVELYKGESVDEVALNGRREELGRLVNDLGEVNLTAIEEFQGLEERHSFLTDQQTDLNKSLDSLQTAIQRINAISRERFQETFEAVNANFKMVFQRLFKGGRAEMVLTDSEDLLEAGIDITAQPPGKKLQGVSLMSGGEKALTAVSLIFSIFLLKPTPFCLLDEVDAPLDDANVGRFNEMVIEMSNTSQFILITHNKRGMEIADVLYGITMQDPGVSKLVSVRLREEAIAA